MMYFRFPWRLLRPTNRCLRKSLFGLIAFTVVLWFNIMFNKPVFHYFKNLDIKSACVLPKFDIYDSSISEFFWNVNPLRCESSEPLMYFNSDGFLQVNISMKVSLGYTSLKCLCQPIYRIDDEDVTIGDAVQCTQPVYLATDFIYAKCTNQDVQVYDGLLYRVDYQTVLRDHTFKNESEDNLSVYFYGYDALSNLIARRTMPLAMKYLEDVLDSYTFKGYTKVGDNTWPNLAALLTGNITDQKKNIVNEVSFIWESFAKKGYATMFSEDYPRLSCFKGFNTQPTNHFQTTFYVAAGKITPIQNRDIRKVLLFMEYKNIKLSDSSYLCVGNTPKHRIMIEYYKQFIKSYKQFRKFGMSFNTELGHDYINFYNHADRDSLDFFEWMHLSGYLKNAVLVFYSDHGPRYSEIQNTNIGRVTGLMPIFSMYIPKHIKLRYPHVHENLLKNTERLTTAFDVHETLKDILNGEFMSNDRIGESNRGISLFRPISEKRSCYVAGIPEHYCPCYAAEDVSVESKQVQNMANTIIVQINKMLRKFSDRCAKLTLKRVLKASKVKSNFERDKSMEERFSIRSYVYNENQDTRYLIVIETEPGNAKFEATVHSSGVSNTQVSGEISRINRYGNQSDCIDVKKLKLYCFCK